MKYNMFNIDRQRINFNSMKAVAGKDVINDVYARDPESDTFWFVGKVARVSGKLVFISFLITGTCSLSCYLFSYLTLDIHLNRCTN